MSYTRKDNSRRIEYQPRSPQYEVRRRRMIAFLNALQIVPALLLILVGAPMLPVMASGHYETTLLGVLIGEGLLFLYLTRASDTPYRIASFTKAVWLFAFAWTAMQLLGGIQFRSNLIIAFATAVLIGT